MMSRPFRCLEDLQTDGSYWEMFDFCRTKHFASNDHMKSSKESQPTIDWDPGATSFSKKGFEILQNIDDQMTVSKSNVRTVDRLTSRTECKEEEGEGDTNEKDLDDENNVQDISFFCYQDEEDGDETNSDTDESDWHYSHTPLINQSNASSNRIVEARQTMNSSLVLENSTHTSTDDVLAEISDGKPCLTTNAKSDHLSWHELDGFKTIIKLVSGSLLGGESFADVYKDIEDTSHNEDGDDFSSVDIESNNSESCTKFRTKIPTLGGVARMVAREEGKTLDEKQYIMYEVLACTFLLDLINKQDVDGRPALARK